MKLGLVTRKSSHRSCAKKPLPKELLGFTLIELLVTIAIIAILAALVITRLASSQTNARNATVEANISEAGKGIEVYKADDAVGGKVISNASPTVPDTLTKNGGTIASIFTGEASSSGTLTYPTKITTVPNDQYTFTYTVPATATTGRVLIAKNSTGTAPGYILCTNIAQSTTIQYFCIQDGSSATSGSDPSSTDGTVLSNSTPALPQSIADATAIYAPVTKKIYVFGGKTAVVNGVSTYSSNVVEYDPSQNTAAVKGTLPLPSSQTSGVYDPDNSMIYLFGNFSDPADLVKYDPVTGTVTDLGDKISPARNFAGAVWDAYTHSVFIIGGGGGRKDISEYNPVTNTITTRPEQMPVGRDHPGVMYDPTTQSIYIIGGYSGVSGRSDILYYQPASSTMQTLPATLPVPVSEVSVGTNPLTDQTYLFAGYGTGGPISAIQMFNASSRQATQLPETLQNTLGGNAVAWDDDISRLFSFGGYSQGGTFAPYSSIIEYAPSQ